MRNRYEEVSFLDFILLTKVTCVTICQWNMNKGRPSEPFFKER